jgi:hypothetical protein
MAISKQGPKTVPTVMASSVHVVGVNNSTCNNPPCIYIIPNCQNPLRTNTVSNYHTSWSATPTALPETGVNISSVTPLSTLINTVTCSSSHKSHNSFDSTQAQSDNNLTTTPSAQLLVNQLPASTTEFMPSKPDTVEAINSAVHLAHAHTPSAPSLSLCQTLPP